MTGTKVVKLKLEEGVGGKLPKIREDPVEVALKLFDDTKYLGPGQFYHDTVKNTRGVSVSPEQLREILKHLEGRWDADYKYSARVGAFLTALIRNSEHESFRIKPQHRIHTLGVYLDREKEITVEGDVGDWLGDNMKAGTIIVKGDAGEYAGGDQHGGEIIVEGSAGPCAGWRSRYGKLDIREGKGK
ncbi:MAG: hypothetical protein V1921_06540 [Candidatus Altiarchaeota archaeon]